MKIGILTYHSARNCGAVLQAYALMKTVWNMGIDCDVIDYKCEKIEKSYVIKKIWQLRSLKEAAKWALTVNTQKKSQKKFDDFLKKHIYYIYI